MPTQSFTTRIRSLVRRWAAAIDGEALASSLVAVSGFYGAPVMYVPASQFEGQRDESAAEVASAQDVSAPAAL